MSDFLSLVENAAREKGGPLTGAELAALEREAARARFLNVVHLAGYPDGRSIVAEWFDRVYSDKAAFAKMCEDYEKNDGDPP